MSEARKQLPFDERNDQDFDDLTKRILAALEEIRDNRSIPATQEELASRAVCTRKTLHNRGWPITELKNIKKARKSNKDDEPKKPASEHKLSEETHIIREKMLIGQVQNFQKQNSELFDRVQDLEEQVAAYATTTRVLEEEVGSLKDEKRKVEGELRRLKQKSAGGTNVVSISATKKGRGEKE